MSISSIAIPCILYVAIRMFIAKIYRSLVMYWLHANNHPISKFNCIGLITSLPKLSRMLTNKGYYHDFHRILISADENELNAGLLVQTRCVCIAYYMQTTFFYLGRFLNKLADDQCSSITNGSIYHVKHDVNTIFYHGSGLICNCTLNGRIYFVKSVKYMDYITSII